MSADDDGTYEPAPAGLADGDVLIADPVEFYEVTKSIAAMVRGGALFVLARDTLKWVNVEDLNKSGAGKLSAIKGGADGAK
ncbi:hypothetical protein [Xylophilus sp.]|uniref:hypothetical protein n=1 Tax=Xylophilus sp. TaxID=2653893 RepID=UPI0013B7B2AB|nr:hypothetical protein [Xylophilus sp.]KAF1045622.1 MAG: hypothetical protein GAK38_02914 [Xylophilus sp.]